MSVVVLSIARIHDLTTLPLTQLGDLHVSGLEILCKRCNWALSQGTGGCWSGPAKDDVVDEVGNVLGGVDILLVIAIVRKWGFVACSIGCSIAGIQKCILTSEGIVKVV